MADLLEERSSNKVVLTYVGMDILGSFVTKDGRKEFKKYGTFPVGTYTLMLCIQQTQTPLSCA